MALKIRLARVGAKKRPQYRIVVADVRSPRDGRFIEKVGIYNPLQPKDSPQHTTLNSERISYWLPKVPSRLTAWVAFLARLRSFPCRPSGTIRRRRSQRPRLRSV